MKLTELNCPSCNGVVDNAEGLAAFFCKYCGHKIIMSDLTEAEIKAHVEIKNMSHEEKMKELENAEKEAKRLEKRQKEKSEMKNIVIANIVIWGLLILFSVISIFVISVNQKNEEKVLQSLVSEITQDIENGNYVSARTKASMIQVTSSGDSTVIKKWDAVREQLLEEINEKERQNK